jgi:hypothetical protein
MMDERIKLILCATLFSICIMLVITFQSSKPKRYEIICSGNVSDAECSEHFYKIIERREGSK